VCLLKKSIYCLKQSPWQRYKKFDSYMGVLVIVGACMLIVYTLGSFQMVLLYTCCFMLNDMLTTTRDIVQID